MRLIDIAKAIETSQLQINIRETETDLGSLVTTITGWVNTIAGVVVFLYLIYSGFIYLTAGGNDEAVKKGQKGIINSIIGLVIIILSYAITIAIKDVLE